jgi:ligand-binding sensor domain-containing protein
LGPYSYFRSVKDIVFSKNKGVFLTEGGLYELKDGVFTFIQFSEYLRTLNLQNDSSYWIGTYGSGVLVRNEQIDTSLILGNSTLNKNYVDALAVSEEGVVWAAPERTNLSKFDGTNWESIPLVGKNYNRCASGVHHHNGITYVTSSDKLFVYDGVEWNSYDVDLDGGGISMTVDGKGSLFVSSTYRYVYKFDGENFTKYSDFNFSIVNDDHKALATDKNGMVWVAGASKVFYFKDNIWEEFLLPSDAKGWGGVRSILFDINNHLWITNSAEYLIEYDGVNFHKHSPKEFVGTSPKIYVKDIALDDDGSLWFASEGVYKYDGVSWRLYDSSNSGLFSNYIQAVEPYEDGVWLGTEVGLVNFKNCGDGEIIEFTKEQVASISILNVENQNLYLSPNPFSDRINIYSDSVDEKILSFHLYDMLGNLHLQWNSLEEGSLNSAEIVLSNNLVDGFYLATISTSDGVFYKKMLKSN